MKAYQLFLQERQWLIRYTAESMTRAVEYFERAIVRDPTFALAHATMAMAYIELAELGAMAPSVAYLRAAEAAARALSADPDLGEAHCAMGYFKVLSEFARHDRFVDSRHPCCTTNWRSSSIGC